MKKWKERAIWIVIVLGLAYYAEWQHRVVGVLREGYGNCISERYKLETR